MNSPKTGVIVSAATRFSLLPLHSPVSTLSLQLVLEGVNVKGGTTSWNSWSPAVSLVAFLSFSSWIVSRRVIAVEAVHGNGGSGRSGWSGRPWGSWICIARTGPWISPFTLISINTWTTRSSRHSNFTLQSWGAVRSWRSNRSRGASVSLESAQRPQVQQVPIGSDHQARLALLTLRSVPRLPCVPSVALWSYWARESGLSR